MIIDNNFQKISIVTPTFNQGRFIEDTILSVIGQGYPNLEYIIIDGGSTDETIEIIKKYENFITHWESEKDNGQSHAINKGFARATGDILGWINSDDIYMPNCLNTVARLLSKEDEAILYGNCLHFRETEVGLISYGSKVEQWSEKTELENSDFIIQPSSFWTRKVWNEVGLLAEHLHFAFDWEWFLRAKARGVRFTGTSKPLSLYRIHENHKTGTGGSKRSDEILTIYNTYSKKYAVLYGMLLKENLNKEGVLVKLISLLLNLFSLPTSKAILLKIIKRKYRAYKSLEIENCIGMM